jgi:uncharacterized protein YdeI (YjbR/CyaY-like superfamily)
VTTERSPKPFRSQAAFQTWLHANHASSDGLWMKFYKKASGRTTIVYAEAVDVALCYGWIDGQSKSLDERCYMQRFTPRRTRSPWSKINRDKVARLVAEGRMHAAGLAEVERAKADGRWDAAYDSPNTMTLPDDFVGELERPKHRKAKAFLATLPRSQTYGIAYRLQSAKKPETRAKRIAEYIGKLDRGEPPIPPPPGRTNASTLKPRRRKRR